MSPNQFPPPSRSAPRAQSSIADPGHRLEAYARASGASDATLRAYQALRDSMASQRGIRARSLARADALQPGSSLAGQSLIAGVGIGLAPDAQAMSGPPGAACICLYTLLPMSPRQAVSNAVAAYGVESLLSEGTAVRAVHTGPIDAYAHRERWRPLHSGISIAHHAVTAGTLGCHVRRSDGSPLVLSNNHVLANVNDAQMGDDVLQQSPSDGGAQPGDVVGALEDFVTIEFEADNMVDCATALIDADDASRDFLYLNPNGAAFYRVGERSVDATPGLPVGKSGRTTGLTSGVVTAVGVTVDVDMGGGHLARFVDQIAIEGSRAQFSLPGDSGSLIWSWDDARRPLGLLFAGGGGTTFANPIEVVLNALEIELAG